MKIRFTAAWYDLWVGVHWDRCARQLYVLPLPCLGVVLDFDDSHAFCFDCNGSGIARYDFSASCPTCSGELREL